jgi:hypothetical protein
MADGSRRGLASRLLWFAALWLAGVLVVGAVALLIRSVLL